MAHPQRDDPADAQPRPQLSPRDRAILTFERDHILSSGLKANAINERFGISTTRYYSILNALLDNPAALELEPMLIRRLRRIRASRARSRSAKRLPR